MSWLSEAFGSKKNPAGSANKYLNQIPGTMQPYFQPFINQGAQAGNQLTNQYNQMTQNPGEFMSKLSQGYQQSPGYQFKLQQALNAGANASARGGMLGTPADVQQSEQTAHDISNQDYEDYMNRILAMFGQGQKGQQGLQEQGFKASTGFGENLGNLLGQQAQYAFGGQAGKNANSSQNWSNLFSGLSNLLPYLM